MTLRAQGTAQAARGVGGRTARAGTCCGGGRPLAASGLASPGSGNPGGGRHTSGRPCPASAQPSGCPREASKQAPQGTPARCPAARQPPEPALQAPGRRQPSPPPAVPGRAVAAVPGDAAWLSDLPVPARPLLPGAGGACSPSLSPAGQHTSRAPLCGRTGPSPTPRLTMALRGCHGCHSLSSGPRNSSSWCVSVNTRRRVSHRYVILHEGQAGEGSAPHHGAPRHPRGPAGGACSWGACSRGTCSKTDPPMGLRSPNCRGCPQPIPAAIRNVPAGDTCHREKTDRGREVAAGSLPLVVDRKSVLVQTLVKRPPHPVPRAQSEKSIVIS